MNRKLFLSFILILLISSCSFDKKEMENKSNYHYSISLGTFKNYEDASNFRFTLDNDIRAKISFELVSSKKYKVLYGKYLTSFEAGKSAYNLFIKNKIRQYEIVLDGQTVLDEFVNVPFIANYLGKSSLFNYNIITKEKELQLSLSEKKIVSINLTKNNDKIFIGAVTDFGMNGNVSFVNDVELLLYNRNSEDISTLKKFGSGILFYTYWDYPDSFRTNFLSFDKKNPRLLEQQIYSWDENGNGKLVKQRSIDLLKDGFPKIPKRRLAEFSDSKNFQLRIKNENGTASFYLKDFIDKSEIFIGFTNNNIYDARWGDDEKYLFIITKPEQKQNKEELFIIDLDKKIIAKKFYGSGFNNLLVRGKLLFFDVLFNGINRIQVFDLEKLKDYDAIEFYGGCSLNTAIKGF